MTYESATLMTVTDPTRVAGDFHEHAKGAIMATGANEVTAWECMTGPMVGIHGVVTNWDSLDEMAASQVAMAANMAPGGSLADLAERYQWVNRIVSEVIHEAGDCQGAYVNTTRFSFATLPEGMEHAGELALGAGANGLRIMTVLAGGEISGQLIGSAFVDSLDTAAGVVAATRADTRFMADLAQSATQLEARTLFRRL